MLTQKKTLVFNKENDNRWYIACPEWEEEQTRLFRETHVYLDEEGKSTPYAKEQQLDNPLDDHTKHEEWVDPHTYLVMDPAFEAYLEQIVGKKAKIAELDMISYSWISNTFAHYSRTGIDAKGASYELYFPNKELPDSFRLTFIFAYLFDGMYPSRLHVKATK